MLSGTHRKFCEGIIAGMQGCAAYAAAFPGSVEKSERRYGSASCLLARHDIKAEIARMRMLAEERAGDSVMSVLEKRLFLGRVVRAQITLLPEDSDLWQSIKETKYWTAYGLPDKLAAIVVDNDLSDEGADAEMNDHLTELLASLRK
jgi:hypothetical protein